ncbi:hypothetical protein GCM10010435_90710 [Winogradskya consettensis]|uniref:Uncharacterized protein n=2 Tax=Winogradskya TaxID=3240235 RepID=A0A919VUZ3_9ACTN|nr:hypothetical protein Aco04nite_68340 [Actinoplanes consettensis]
MVRPIPIGGASVQASDPGRISAMEQSTVEEPTTRPPAVSVPLERRAAPVAAPIVDRILRVPARDQRSRDVSAFQSFI